MIETVWSINILNSLEDKIMEPIKQIEEEIEEDYIENDILD